MIRFFVFLCQVCLLQTLQIRENATAVLRLSVLQDHHVCLPCLGSDSLDVVWTHQDRTVLVTRQRNYEMNRDGSRFQLQLDGSLCLLRLQLLQDAGTYRCNDRLQAELQVLTGQDFLLPAGRTLLLPCSSSKPRQRWVHRREGQTREGIFTRFKNGTVKPEREDRRFSFQHDALQILDLLPGDAGEYLCNGKLEARVTVQTGCLVSPECANH
ncbi:hypothetical protein LDENG_00223030 [Lucifuga dentata]|nr:hypothetical protein LDENG_00223030 [Lucifuga dentata]